MRLVVLGAGAIGSLLGGMLSEAGSDVILVGRLPHVKAIQSKGLHIDGVSGRRTIRVTAREKLSAVGDQVDIVLCTVKAYDTRQAAIDAKPLIGKECLFLCIQNGLNVENEAVEILGANNVARGVTNNGALFVKPGYIKHTGLSDTIIGCPSERWRNRLEKLTNALNAAGLPAKITNDIQEVVWSKVLINVGINAIGAITHLRNGELLRDASLKALMRSAVQEGLKVAQKLGIHFFEDVVDKTFKVAEATALNKNSMLQDVEKGKRTEIEFINGAIGRTGEKLGIATPINNTLTALVKGLESRRTS
nr:2-dehydropantoate 2-reductase [Candidatus Njordarchaeota archaeon]